MKYAEYVAGILLCKYCEFDENDYYNSRHIEFFLGIIIFWCALYIVINASTRASLIHKCFIFKDTPNYGPRFYSLYIPTFRVCLLRMVSSFSERH